MRAVRKQSQAMARKMRSAFFDVSPEGVLVYLDPFIGLLRHQREDLSVRAEPGKARFTLTVGGTVTQTFEWQSDIGSTCWEAFAAYFRQLEQTFKQQSRTA